MLSQGKKEIVLHPYMYCKKEEQIGNPSLRKNLSSSKPILIITNQSLN
jgi:hypothetical protein